MPDFALSVVIPARKEEFLQRTIEDVLAKSEAETEIIAILDGYWPDKGIPQHPKTTVIHHEQNIGQRAAVNEGVNLSRAKYIMKLDAHCALDKGFDVKLMADCEPDWTVLPRMHTLIAFVWKCVSCGNETPQGPVPEKCVICGKAQFERKMVWDRNKRKCTDYMWIDQELRMRYFDGPCIQKYGDPHKIKKECHHKYKDWAKPKVTDVMVGVGCCFFMHRQRYLDLGGLDEQHGGWGQMAVEIAAKTWLSGGRQVINKNTWFAHLFRTQKGFGFPYAISYGQQEAARKYSRKLWQGNNWPKRIHDFQWLIDRFAPLPGWHTRPITIPFEVVYYTDNRCEERILLACREQITLCCNGSKVISVSQWPISFGENIVLRLQRSHLTMFKQILAGLERATADIIYFCEHDVLYSESHFRFTPADKEKIYYNLNVWQVRASDGKAVIYTAKRTSQLCAYRDVLLKHYRARVKKVEQHGFTRRMGFEPGTHGRAERVDDLKSDTWMSEQPNIDIRHPYNLTASRWSPKEFRSQRNCRNWQESDTIPGWGLVKGRFEDFLSDVQQSRL